MNNKAIFFTILTISIATLALAVFNDRHIVFTIATIISHAALVLFGYFYSKNKTEQLFKEIRKDILG